MAMETLGGNLPAGRPVAVFAGGKTHVFAIGAGGMMNHWTSPNGIDWQGPDVLERLSTNLEPSYPCAIAIGNAVHVFAIGNGGPFSNGGPLVRWLSPDGTDFGPPVEDRSWPIPGGANGIAVSSPNPNRIDAFAVTPFGLVRYSWSDTLTSLGAAPLPDSGSLPPGNLPRCVPASVSSAPDVTDVFLVGPDGSALRWRITGPTWRTSVLPQPADAPAGTRFRSGFAAVSPAAGQIELFAITTGGLLAHWSFDGESVQEVSFLPSPPMSLTDGVPAAIAVGDRSEAFAIGQPPDPFTPSTGSPLVRWRRRRGGEWSGAKVIGANLSAGGLSAAVTSDHRIDAFGLAGNGLQHWPAGIRAATTEPWANWANSLQMNPAGHCHPSTEEEVVAIVKTAERVSGARVRAVGSSWSFPDITMPPASGFIVETNETNGLMTHVIDGSVLTEHAPDPKYLVHVEAGIQVEALMRELDIMGLAPFTLGGSSGQTLAGVISTSVHGSHWDRGPIPNAVRAIQLVGPGGIRFWIEPDQWRITKEEELRKRLGPDVQIRYDDDWFDSVLVSMGAMGIVTSVVFEVTDQYLLQKSCEETTWSQLKPELENGSRFQDPDSYLMVAIDPFLTGERTCFVVTCRSSDGPVTAPSASSDALGAFCKFSTVTVGDFLESVAGVAGALTAPIRRASGPGLLGDLLGPLFDSIPNGSEHLAAFASAQTREALKPGQSFTDIAHSIMAPPNPGECAARGLAVELAFDATTGAYLTFVDEAIKLLDQRRSEGMVLGGWFSLRFVGPSRAILSPQQSARTCMIEFVAVRSLQSTVPLLDELEKLGKVYGAIQHWGMFSIPNLVASDLPRAYPRLDTWRRVRREITGDGAIQTFESDFTARVGLDAPPAGAPVVWQQDWKRCSKCLGMAYAGGAPGPCPAGGTHDHRASGNYGFAHNAPWVPGQRKWRWCSKCLGMTFEGAAPGVCPAGGAHDLSSSGEYTILRNGQSNWRWCSKCQCLAFAGGAPGPCPADGTHDHSGSGNYWLPFAPLTEPAPAPDMAPASAPVADLAMPPVAGPELPTRTGQAIEFGSVLAPALLNLLREQPHSSLEVPGQRGWRWCRRCTGLTRAGGECVGGEPHLHDASGSYVIPLNAPAAPGQAHWRLCKKCQTLVFRDGPCFAGDRHDFAGSGDYTLRAAGQNEWRHCKNCQGLWFSGNGGQGTCPAPGGGHDLGIDDYVI